MLLLDVSLVVFLSAANPVAATTNGPESGEAETKTVCRSVKLTGTRFGKRYCKTVSEWRAIEEKSVGAVRELQSRPMINCNQPNGEPC